MYEISLINYEEGCAMSKLEIDTIDIFVSYFLNGDKLLDILDYINTCIDDASQNFTVDLKQIRVSFYEMTENSQKNAKVTLETIAHRYNLPIIYRILR